MTDEPETNSAIDLDKFRELVSLMEKHGVTEVDLRNGPQRWLLRRGPKEVTQVVHSAPAMNWAPPAAGYAPQPAPALAAAPAGTAPAAAPAEESGVFIKAPTVGTFYSAGGPGEKPYATVGTRVTNDTVVCIIEAMKVMNHIQAEVTGTITEVLVKNGEAVDFDKPLFRVKLG